jgi:acyl-CoA dehydrogenase
MTSPLPYSEEHHHFRDTVKRFVQNEVVPHHPQWERDGMVSREFWRKAGAAGLLCTTIPEPYGGYGADFLTSVIITEELMAVGASGPLLYLHSDIVAPYLQHYGSEALKHQWLPKMAQGAAIGAIGMTEPGAGSDLQGIRTHAVQHGQDWVISGQKIFISNGQLADLIVLACKTNTDGASRSKEVSLFVVDTSAAGFSRGKNLDKLGMQAQDTSELFFDQVRVGADQMIGQPGQGFRYLMEQLAQERLLVGVAGVAAAEAALRWTVEYVNDRQAFASPIASLQTVRHTLAEVATEIKVGRAFLDQCIARHLQGSLSNSEASMAKYWLTEMQFRTIDRCLQLFGGYGYMREYPIARAWADARVQRIYGGTSEIMKEIIARDVCDARNV